MQHIVLAIAAWIGPADIAAEAGAPVAPSLGPPKVLFDGRPAPPRSPSAAGFSGLAAAGGPQAAVLERAGGAEMVLAVVREGESVEIEIPASAAGGLEAAAEVEVRGGEAEAVLSIDGGDEGRAAVRDRTARIGASAGPGAARALRLVARGRSGEAAVLWKSLRATSGGAPIVFAMAPSAAAEGPGAPPRLPPLRSPIAAALLEWDWRMADGIGAPRRPATHGEAIAENLRRGDLLLRAIEESGAALKAERDGWEALRGS